MRPGLRTRRPRAQPQPECAIRGEDDETSAVDRSVSIGSELQADVTGAERLPDVVGTTRAITEAPRIGYDAAEYASTPVAGAPGMYSPGDVALSPDATIDELREHARVMAMRIASLEARVAQMAAMRCGSTDSGIRYGTRRRCTN